MAVPSVEATLTSSQLPLSFGHGRYDFFMLNKTRSVHLFCFLVNSNDAFSIAIGVEPQRLMIDLSQLSSCGGAGQVMKHHKISASLLLPGHLQKCN